MRAVIQRVLKAQVMVDSEIVGKIDKGLLVYLGAHQQDSERDVVWMANKIQSLRIFTNSEGKMSHSIKDIQGEVLVISQFTLFGDVRKGNRPSFDTAAPPILAEKLYDQLCSLLRSSGLKIQTGRFRAMMQVQSIGEGPVTILVDSEKKF